MKKIIVIITVVLLSLNSVNAQNQTISVSYGAISTDQVVINLSMEFSSLFSQVYDNGIYEISSIAGPLSLSYYRILESNKRWSFGGSIVYNHINYINTENTNNAYIFNTLTIAPEAKIKYLNPQNKFNIYGSWGIGIAFFTYKKNEENETRTIPHINFQVTPLGIEYGGNIKGFLELGVGYKGILSAGISVYF